MFRFASHQSEQHHLAELLNEGLTVRDAQDMLDVMANAPSRCIVLHQRQLAESFFDLKSGIAGEILQKVSNYGIRLSILGDYSNVESKSLRDFIYESNKTGVVLFVPTLQDVFTRYAKG